MTTLHPPPSTLHPLLSDFGLALQTDALGTLTHEGDVLGTPAYMAPEQAAGRKAAVGPQSDVYGLGALLYELLSGRPPFQGGMATVLHQVLHDEPPVPRLLRPGVPADLETVCLRALAKEPGRRYATAGELADDLRRFLEHRPVRARRTGPVGRFGLWCRRKPALAGTLAAAVVTVGVVAGLMHVRVLEERDRFRVERDRAQENLYRSLVSDAQGQMRARDTSWWWKALDNLRAAAALGVDTRDPAALRELAVQCMGTAYPCFRLRDTWAGHDGAVLAVAGAADGRRAASGGRDRTVRLWDLATGRLLATFTGHGGPVSGVAFHPARPWLVSGSQDGSVRLWDLETRDSARAFDLGGGAVRGVAVSPNGKWIAAACADGKVRLIASPERLDASGAADVRSWAGHTETVTCLTFSPDGRQLVSGARDRTMRFWDVPDGRLSATWTSDDWPTSVAFGGPSAGRGGLLGNADAESFGFTWRRLGDKSAFRRDHLHAGTIHQLAYDRTGRPLTASADGTLRLWEPRHFTELAVAQGELPGVFTAAFLPDDSAVLAGYADGRIRVWDLAEPPQRALVGIHSQNAAFVGPGPRLVDAAFFIDLTGGLPGRSVDYAHRGVEALAVHPDGRRFAFTREPGVVEVWELGRPAMRKRWPAAADSLRALAGSPDGALLATADAAGAVRVWDWDGAERGQPLAARVGPVHQLAWAPDGKRLVVSGPDGAAVLRLDDAAGRVALPRVPAGGPVACGTDVVAFARAPDAVELVAADTGRPKRTLRGHRGPIKVLAFGPGDRWLAGAAADGAVHLWDVAGGTELALLPSGQSPTWLSFDPNGRYLAGGGPYPTAMQLWVLPPRTGAAYTALAPAHCGHFLPDGSGVLFGTSTGGVLRWQTADVEKALADVDRTGRESGGAVRVSKAETVVEGGHATDALGIWGIAASPDGRWFATAGHDRTVKLWDATSGQVVRTFGGFDDLVWCVAFSADGRYLAAGGPEVAVFEVETGRKIHAFRDHQAMVAAVAFHPSGRWLATAGYDGAVHLREFPSGRDLGRLHRFDGAVHSLAFRPDGRWLAAGWNDPRAALWPCGAEPPPAAPPQHALAGHPGPVRAVAFRADRRILATGSEAGVIDLWDGNTFDRITRLKGGTGQIRGLSFSTDGRYLAGAAYVAPTIVWDFDRLRLSLRALGLDW